MQKPRNGLKVKMFTFSVSNFNLKLSKVYYFSENAFELWCYTSRKLTNSYVLLSKVKEQPLSKVAKPVRFNYKCNISYR